MSEFVSYLVIALGMLTPLIIVFYFAARVGSRLQIAIQRERPSDTWSGYGCSFSVGFVVAAIAVFKLWNAAGILAYHVWQILLNSGVDDTVAYYAANCALSGIYVAGLIAFVVWLRKTS